MRFGLKASVLDVLNQCCFTDVSNRAASNTGVLDVRAFFNQGRSFTVGLSATL